MVTQVREIQAQKPNPIGDVEASKKAPLAADIITALACFAVMVTLNLIWSAFDYRFPTSDESVHIINSMDAKELLIHCRPWHWQWWNQCFTISSFYPPLAYFVNGAFLIALGQSRFAEHVAMSFYSGLMVISMYALTRLLRGGRLAASMAAVILCSYPLIDWLTHTFFLDMPAVAMTAFALVIFLWWQSHQQKPMLWRTILCGLSLGVACLTKQMVVAYMVPLCLYFLIVDAVRLIRRQQAADSGASLRIVHTFCVALIAVLISAPFVVYSYQLYRNWLSANIEAFASVGVHHTFMGNLEHFWSILPSVMSPPLFFVFLLSFLFLRRQDYGQLLPIIIATAGGLAFTCTCMGTDLEERYLVPFLIAPAIFSAYLVEKLFFSAALWRRILAIGIIAITIAKYVMYNFSPYPLPLPQQPSFARCAEHEGNPLRYADWGHALVLDTIKKLDGNKMVYLNVLANHEVVHINAFRLLLREQGNFAILPTGSREWTIVGDRVRFVPSTARCFHWYLFKTGSSGFRFCNQQSRMDYERLVNYVRQGGDYSLVVEKCLPDGSELMLYRRKF